jgi:hypothetical protein
MALTENAYSIAHFHTLPTTALEAVSRVVPRTPTTLHILKVELVWLSARPLQLTICMLTV